MRWKITPGMTSAFIDCPPSPRGLLTLNALLRCGYAAGLPLAKIAKFFRPSKGPESKGAAQTVASGCSSGLQIPKSQRAFIGVALTHCSGPGAETGVGPTRCPGRCGRGPALANLGVR